MIEFLDSIDSQLFLAINSLHTAYLDRFMMLFTGRFIWVPMYAAIIYVALRCYGWRRGLVAIFAATIAVACADQVCGHLLRPMIGRLRPANLDNPLSEFANIVNGYRGGTYGFPSCHAANSFALAMFAAFMMRSSRAGVWIFIWAIANSYSRLYLGVHYPGDLTVGAIIGCLFGGLWWWLFRIVPLRGTFSDPRITGSVRVTDIVIVAGAATAIGIGIAAF